MTYDTPGLFYKEAGHGPVVVLLHGGGVDHTYWKRQFNWLGSQYRVIAVDSRGHGRSPDSDEPFGYRSFARSAAGLVRQLGVETATFVGHSDGGCVSIAIALQDPDLVARLVLLGTPWNIDNYRPGVSKMMANLGPDDMFGLLGDNFDKALRANRSNHVDDESWARYMRKLVDMWARQPDFTADEIRTIDVPTLVLHSNNEIMYGIEVAKEFAALLPHAELVVIPDSGHDAAQDNPDAVNAALNAFLRPQHL
ncbi:alpha/beta fold hydrolase [Mycobacterium talmoniae]|uniref:Arylesterase n=1 Tax=Mycobacterium talmoniae TaxID=1858794 RepID=A0A1S1NR44_9MYCO|nr:alpha/beta hydrolase [Mycobacterium talmoniae]OHV06927.1 hypothetical protein BKN37_00360 [Mycobacterium talmoniae]PQM48009.1 Arylesterase [Mycobacterium talmoniae]